MTHQILLILLATIARALIAHAFGEGLRLALEYVAPSTPPLVCIAIGLLIGVILVEFAATIWRHRNGVHNLT